MLKWNKPNIENIPLAYRYNTYFKYIIRSNISITNLFLCLLPLCLSPFAPASLIFLQISFLVLFCFYVSPILYFVSHMPIIWKLFEWLFCIRFFLYRTYCVPRKSNYMPYVFSSQWLKLFWHKNYKAAHGDYCSLALLAAPPMFESVPKSSQFLKPSFIL